MVPVETVGKEGAAWRSLRGAGTPTPRARGEVKCYSGIPGFDAVHSDPGLVEMPCMRWGLGS